MLQGEGEGCVLPGTAPLGHAPPRTQPATAPGWQQPSYEQLLAAEVAKGFSIDRCVAWDEVVVGVESARGAPLPPRPPPPLGAPSAAPRPAAIGESGCVARGRM